MPNRTLRHHLAIRLALPVGFIIGAVATAAMVESVTDLKPTDRETSAPTQLDRVLEAHAGECWFSGQDALVSPPGHVVVTYSDGRAVYSERLVNPALESIFGDRDVVFTVVAFCK